MSEKGIVTLERVLPYAPQDVWRALTEPALLAKWWAPGDVRPIVGHRFTLDMGEFGQQPCQVLAVEPETMMAYAFSDGTIDASLPWRIDSTITWRLEPQGTGTRLCLEHAGFDLDSPIGRRAYEGMGAGWPHVLDRIEDALIAAGPGTP